MEGRIILVLDPQLETSLKLVCVEGSRALREHRVDAVVTLEEGAPPAAAVAAGDAGGAGATVLYLTRPLPTLVRLVAAQVRALCIATGVPTSVVDLLRFAANPGQWNIPNLNSGFLNDVLAVNPISRFLTSMIFMSAMTREPMPGRCTLMTTLVPSGSSAAVIPPGLMAASL